MEGGTDVGYWAESVPRSVLKSGRVVEPVGPVRGWAPVRLMVDSGF